MRPLRHPIAVLAAWTAALTCWATPWLLTPPTWVRLTAAVLAGLTGWLAVRAVGGLVALLRSPARRRLRLAAPLAVLLVLVGAPGSATAGPPAVGPVSAVPGVPGAGPLRITVPLAAGRTDADRARAAVTRLVRAGGTARSTVLVAVPTGSGWVDWRAVGELERRSGGDVATVTVQYAEQPSWLEYLRGPQRADRSAAAVLRAVRTQLAALPAATRPRLLVFGESLGAVAAASAVRTTPVDGCLLAGLPGSAGGPPVPGCVEVRNVDDPVAWWRPGLLATPRAGLPWLPVVTFWQTTGALVTSLDGPPGSGHSYGRTLGPAWQQLLDGPGSTLPRGEGAESQRAVDR
ncbi:alpha/beta-hydrolase family protein [Modestobacter sp. NPDC049651]|uniref:alpha/beta-hydrolase family protein n=1 Tax=unclassified Modestobacter TaxID=2643866 RepID=UPI0033E17351